MITGIASASTICNLSVILRRYGFLGVSTEDSECRDGECDSSGSERPCDKLLGRTQCHVSHLVMPEYDTLLKQSNTRKHHERGPAILFLTRKWLGCAFSEPAYHALLDHVSFSGPNIEPLWTNAAGRAVIAWLHEPSRKRLLVGLKVVDEIVRHTQGDPGQVGVAPNKARFGFSFERPNYLFDAQLHPRHRTQPWADRLGFALAEWLARAANVPLVEPLPDAARGAVLLTGDDDQAELAKYKEQLDLIGNFPITYFLLPNTRQTSATLAKLPANVELGLHVDALDCPERYDDICQEQAQAVRNFSPREVRSIRNHGYLNRGYLGHLEAWEDCDLELDVNYPGVDGTALNGSFLPFRVRRPDGSWSSHLSLLTAFGDGMLSALGLSERTACRRIMRVVRQIECSHPGVVVFNLHPQNVSEARRLHRTVLAIGKRPGWIALGVNSYLDWLHRLDRLELRQDRGRVRFAGAQSTDQIVVRVPVARGWSLKHLTDFM